MSTAQMVAVMIAVGVAVALGFAVVWFRDARRNDEVEHDEERITPPEER